MIIFGTYPKISKDDDLFFGQKCPSCSSTDTYLVMVHSVPHVFFIPILFLSADEGPGMCCKSCNKKFELEGKIGYFIEKYYNRKITKEELKKELSKIK